MDDVEQNDIFYIRLNFSFKIVFEHQKNLQPALIWHDAQLV